MKHNYHAECENILLRPIEHKDIESLRMWRNDTYATRFLRQIGEITTDMQEKWYESYLKDDTILTFAIDETNELKRLVGSISLYDFENGVAEFGKIQIGDVDAHGKGIGRIATALILLVGFEVLNLNKIFAYVHQDNIAAYKTYMKVGFKVVGEKESVVGGKEIKLEIDEDSLRNSNTFITKAKCF